MKLFISTDLKSPFNKVMEFRPAGGKKGYVETWDHPDDIIKMLNSKGKVL